MVHEETVGPPEESLAEARHQVPLQVQFENRVYVNAGAVVPAAPAHQPHVLAIGILVYSGHDPQIPPLRKFCPAVEGAIRIAVLGT